MVHSYRLPISSLAPPRNEGERKGPIYELPVVVVMWHMLVKVIVLKIIAYNDMPTDLKVKV